ncbi:Gfo/Idh/MocA family oxidoreductase [Paenibacillus sp. HB172176]|uniref:Gfo/Idh/MocA family protein n=1 Tax=Paenibacillus sp. HB172176 TaxID=2493690 RepID=UPI001439E494|nr:Gfo/Idh/MocA family oxidoreductase [Paenibacillus sp. HB172176]
MVRVGLIGYGFMGRMHFENYVRLMKEGAPVELVAICDLRIEELKNAAASGNIATSQDVYDLSSFALYDNVEKMLENEQLDMVDLTLPTQLHADMTCSMLERGLHVMCEKPIAFHSKDGRRMTEAAKATNKTLMIGQCLRFWPAYELLKECVEDGRYGKMLAGSFFRGGATPPGWFRDGSLSGGCLLDMHIHDTDVVNWLFGKPEQVSTIARNVVPGSAYDIVSTNYRYGDGKVLNAQADWTLEGDFGFAMTYRVNFEKANLIFENNQVKVNPHGEAGFIAELSPEMGYYRELKYLVESIENGTPVSICTPESAVESLEIIEAEIESANRNGAPVSL